jgi:hypothetical protein
MAIDFWSLLEPSELTRIPAKMKKFLHRGERPPSEHFHTWDFFAYGYEHAFNELAEATLNRWPHGDYMRMPLFYLCRHSIELHLKTGIKEYAETMGEPYSLDGHSLTGLWNQFKNLTKKSGFVTDDDWTPYCEKLINHINESDPDGERFRYPRSKAGDVFTYTRIELEELVKAHYQITLYCGGCGDMLRESWA